MASTWRHQKSSKASKHQESFSSDEESIAGINSRTDLLTPLGSPAAQGISIVIEETDDNDDDNDDDNEDDATDNSGNIV